MNRADELDDLNHLRIILDGSRTEKMSGGVAGI